MSTDNLKGLAAPHASDSIYQEAKQLNAESRAGLSPLKPPPAGVQPLAVPVTIGEEDAALVGIGRRDALPVTESPPLGSTAGIERRDSDRGITSPWMKSQAHLLKPSETNPMPTAVPPPISANSGTLGVRHVLFIIGLPERGKPFIARRLKSYLSFFHGADVQLFDISEYAKRTGEEPGSDANARLLLEELKFFMEKSAAECGSNMHVHKDKRTSEVPDAAAPSAAAGGESPRASSGETPPLGPMRFSESTTAGTASTAPRSGIWSASDVPGGDAVGGGGGGGGAPHDLLVDESDRRRKNVDSGRVAIIFASDSFRSFKEKWSGTSKERRHWAAEVLALDRALNCKLIFIEVIVNQPETIISNIRAKRRAMGEKETSADTIREYLRRIKEYQRMYVTLQDDGSEDDLSYIKLINYGQKVVTNRMHGYLRMRIAQFLTTIHTTPHVIYLSRHGQSEYNVLGKIGGNPPLSDKGDDYARRLGEWVPEHICRKRDGSVIKARLWTSSLQRTIRTAACIPHPVLSSSSSSSSSGGGGGGEGGGGRGERDSAGGGVASAASSSPIAARRNPYADAELPPWPPVSAANSAASASSSSSAAYMVGTAPPVPVPSPLVSRGPSHLEGAGSSSSALGGGLGGALGGGVPGGAVAGSPPGDAEGLFREKSSEVMHNSPSLSKLAHAALGAAYAIHAPNAGLEPEDRWEQMSPRVYRNLDEIFAGEYEGLTYAEIKRRAPDEASLRAMDKIGYRYPRGESYFDLVARLDPLVHELESYHEPLLIVSHQAVLRVLYSYLMGKPRTQLTKVEVPLHTVTRITYDGWNPPYEERFFLGPDPVGLQDDGQKNL